MTKQASAAIALVSKFLDSLTGFRKTLVIAFAFISSCILLAVGLLNGDQFVSINQVIMPAYFAANLGEHYMHRKDVK